jgi:hypothetical protein
MKPAGTLLLLFLLSCGESQEQLEARCSPVLTRILEIQDHREIIRKDFHITLEDYTAGRMSPPVWQREKSVWLSQENELAREVSTLYDYSYKTKCLR